MLSDIQQTPLVTLAGVGKAYENQGRQDQPVLSGVDLSVHSGETVVVLGRSGSGKTTLLNLIGGLDRADSGRVISCGLDLTRASGKQLVSYRARSIGFVFQFYNLLPTLTAAENIEVGLRVAGASSKEAEDETRRILARIGLAETGPRFPGELSGGEQQRIAIARAFVRRPRLLLADEPTGNLDDETAAGVIRLFGELAAEAGTAVVIVTHDSQLVERATRTVEISQGRLREREG